MANVWRIPILADRRATWADAEQLTFDQAYVESLDVSRDGECLALNSNRGGYIDLWTMPIEGGEMEQVTMYVSPDWFPTWSPDGEEIAFQGCRAGNRDIWVVPASQRWAGSPTDATRILRPGTRLVSGWKSDRIPCAPWKWAVTSLAGSVGRRRSAIHRR